MSVCGFISYEQVDDGTYLSELLEQLLEKSTTIAWPHHHDNKKIINEIKRMGDFIYNASKPYQEMSKRGNYGKWTQEQLELAIQAVSEKRLGLNAASRQYEVPKATIKRHAHEKNQRSKTKALGRMPVFSATMEKELAEHILQFEERMFGLTITDVRRLAFDVAEKHAVEHNFNRDKRMAGKAWYYGFMARNKNLTLRQPEATSMQRIKGFTEKRVVKFFTLLEGLVDEKRITGSKIYNVDESGFTTVQKKPSKVIGLKGKRQVGAATSSERGVNTTIVCCTSASGNYIPPMIIFKRKRQPQELELGAPTGSIVTISDTGYINSELFVEWLKHFYSHVSSSKDDPVLLLLVGHSTHSKNLAAINYARDHGIILLQLPSHTTHRLQPLDVAFLDHWVISALLNEAYGKAASVRTAANAFKASGIWPVDRLIFTDSIFSASRALKPSFPLESTETPSTSSRFLEDLTEVLPLPQADPCENTKPVRSQDAAVLTITPYKADLESRKRPTPKRIKKKLNFGTDTMINQEEKDGSSKKKKKKIAAFIDELDVRVAGMSREGKVSHQECTKPIRGAYNNNTSKQAGKKTTPYWWNDAIQEQRKQCTSSRRTLMRLLRNPNIPEILKRVAEETETPEKSIMQTYQDRKKKTLGEFVRPA
ncbi:hypothetical protein MML48_1g00950 [Holotrichia oblita]|uniref:Uncharacterized protein n=1 Tax=Holotrichia oblita TaxID=644536 RepID=A0ACB9TS95_HOLOL|nr:hypothetical protein MML48_1g00950 [Holotrichia oblita]